MLSPSDPVPDDNQFEATNWGRVASSASWLLVDPSHSRPSGTCATVLEIAPPKKKDLRSRSLLPLESGYKSSASVDRSHPGN